MIKIIADIGANHNKDLDIAIKLCNAVKKSGADCLKIQYYTSPDEIIADKNYRIKETTSRWHSQKLIDIYSKGCISKDLATKIINYCHLELDLPVAASVFSHAGVDEIYDLVSHLKIAASDANDYDLVEYAVDSGTEVHISTGLLKPTELQTYRAFFGKIVPYHSISNYNNSPIETLKLDEIIRLKNNFHKVGFSDHTFDSTASRLAVSFGATYIEKHIKLDNNCLDVFALNPSDFYNFCKSIRESEEVNKNNYGQELRRGIYVIKDIEEGGIYNYNNIGCKRPLQNAIDAYELKNIIGRTATEKKTAGHPLTKI